MGSVSPPGLRRQADRGVFRWLCQELVRHSESCAAAAAKMASGSAGISACVKWRSNDVSISFSSGVKVPPVEVISSSIDKASRSRGEYDIWTTGGAVENRGRVSSKNCLLVGADVCTFPKSKPGEFVASNGRLRFVSRGRASYKLCGLSDEYS